MVNFHDTVGLPIIGYLRCSKVHRRASLQDLQNSENLDSNPNLPASTPVATTISINSTSTTANRSAKLLPHSGSSSGTSNQSNCTSNLTNVGSESSNTTTSNGPPNKKLKTSKATSTAAKAAANAAALKVETVKPSNPSAETANPANWNLTNFRLLADCVSSLTEQKLERKQLDLPT
jgi:hypothetical protein